MQIPLLKKSMICDVGKTIHTAVTRRSCYIGLNSHTLSQHQPSLLLETMLLKQSNRTQIPLLKQSVICDAEIIYNNSNKRINKEVVTPAATTTPQPSTIPTIVTTFFYGR
jgi:hypothetical protein